MEQTYCLGGRHYSNTINLSQYEKVNPKTKKFVKIIRRTCSICGRDNSQIFTKQMTNGQVFIKGAKCKNNHHSSMSDSALTDLNSKGNILKLHEKCPNSNCGCQKILTFTPHQYMLEGGSIKSKLQKVFRGNKKACDTFNH